MVAPLNCTHEFKTTVGENEPENIESKVIPPHHLILICQSFFFSLSLSLVLCSKLIRKGASFLSEMKEPPLFCVFLVWWRVTCLLMHILTGLFS